jgi:4-hydroxy 2-oxovalerate aldolase
MNPITILDASLRDGGHRTNFHFTDDELEAMLVPLDHSGIEYIEIGYRNGSIHPIANIGRAGLCDRDYLLTCRRLINRAKVAVMAHPGNIDEPDLQELQDCGVQLLRLCVAKQGLDKALSKIKLAKSIQLDVSVNFIHLSYYSEAELERVVDEVSHYQPNLIYFADSNGSLFPEKIKAIYEKFTSRYTIPFGFHAHDNLGLAQANALAAMASGARFIDASLAGMGKGTGNLKTEFFIACLQARGIKDYDLQAVLTAANRSRQAFHIGQELLEMDEFVRGIFDLSTADLKLFKKNHAAKAKVLSEDFEQPARHQEKSQ